jgi:hypothetical protein
MTVSAGSTRFRLLLPWLVAIALSPLTSMTGGGQGPALGWGVRDLRLVPGWRLATSLTQACEPYLLTLNKET